MKKSFVCFVLLLCLVFMASCVYIPDKTITGDVKDKDTQIENPDITVTDVTDVPVPDTDSEAADTKVVSAEQLIAELSASPSDGASFYNDAHTFALALKTKDKKTVADYTGGKAYYYDFLDDVEISSFKIYPFEFSSEYIAGMSENGKYYVTEDNYFLELDVASSSSECFTKGKNIYYMGFAFDPVSGNKLSAFVPAENAENHIFYEWNNDYTEYFIDEFCALYLPRLTDGKNFPDSFDFSSDNHLITHLMARSGLYGDYPPFSLSEINDFITQVFDGNDGISPSELDHDAWLFHMPYDVADPDKLYGCSYAHGGVSVQRDIISIEKDGDEEVYTLQLYSDYSHFAKAMKLVFHFDTDKGELPELEMIELRDNTQNPVATTSV